MRFTSEFRELEYSNTDPFETKTGPFLARLRDDIVECGLQIEKEHTNSLGQAHGGFVYIHAQY